ncbi:hypothetical protein LJ737_08495 [Hymenobacter sp. 15J16-1T3B]|uniref:hypothetical protein n=1 Tax=Hymenobacter sp. 15J16-1T3B TaxID=2886941 RepID=UPI001D10DB26|nr:hypothetical protein [Hymenobacter sp. 15J16-1T3B]MCC3157275.1 hypothetical protein [Hymenobacter sp. 15J16-1T3B]
MNIIPNPAPDAPGNEWQLVNPRSYGRQWRRELPLLLLALGLLIWAGLIGYLGPVLLIAALGLLYVVQERHPRCITLTTDTITVEYYQQFRPRQFVWPRAETIVGELSKPGSLLSSRPVYELRLAYAEHALTLSTADGFSQAQLQALYDELEPPVELDEADPA